MWKCTQSLGQDQVHVEWTKLDFFFFGHHNQIVFRRNSADRFQAQTVAVNRLALENNKAIIVAFEIYLQIRTFYFRSMLQNTIKLQTMEFYDE